MILENGLVRTMDPQIPTQRALAIAGDRIAGGVGVHESALASPEVVDLGGRVVVPGLTDSHVHFPTWALAQTEVALDGCRSLEETLARIAGALRESGRVIRGYGWRSGDWPGGADPTAARLDEVTGETPAAMIAKDYHSLWLNSAALALAGGDLEVEGGVVERDARGEPTGVLREEAAWRFKERYLVVPDDVYVDAMRAGLKLAAARGVTSVHDKDGWLGALRLWQRLERAGALTLRVWQSVPADQVGSLASLGIASGLGSPLLRIGYLKAFMDGTLGSETALMLDGSGVRITSGEQLAEIIRAGAAAGFPVAVHAIGDGANREALDAFEADTADLGAARVAPPDRARAAARAGGSPPLRLARRRLLGSVLARDLRPRPRRPLLGRQDRRRVRLPVAARLGRRRRQRLGRADRGARPAGRHPRGRPADDRRARGLAPRAGGHGPAGVRGDDASRPPGSAATSAGAAA